MVSNAIGYSFWSRINLLCQTRSKRQNGMHRKQSHQCIGVMGAHLSKCHQRPMGSNCAHLLVVHNSLDTLELASFIFTTSLYSESSMYLSKGFPKDINTLSTSILSLAYRWRKMILECILWFKVGYCFCTMFYDSFLYLTVI